MVSYQHLGSGDGLPAGQIMKDLFSRVIEGEMKVWLISLYFYFINDIFKHGV